MTEYIIREEAMTVPVLPKEQRVEFRSIDEAFEEGWRQALEMLAFMPAAEVVEKPMWISAKEKLPEDEQRVLVCYGYKNRDGELNEHRHLMTASYYCFDAHPHWDHENSPNGITVTHWMPLPEPPEGEA